MKSIKVSLQNDLSVTKEAAEEISVLTKQYGYKPNYIRISVVGGGCSGYSYRMEYVNHINSYDTEFNSNGITIVVDDKSLPFIRGTELDYVTKGFERGFKFNNPNETARCGCGESFTI